MPQQSYVTGSRLLDEGKAGDAVPLLNDAHVLVRQNADYELKLIAALTATGKTAPAEPILADVLQRKPNDGRANLVAARLMEQKGNAADAEAYYHRAIYGEWPGNPGMHRVSARMELVSLLASRKEKEALLPELISLEAEAPITADIQKRLAELFLFAGAPARAANLYEALIRKDPKNIWAYEGLGDADLEQGKYGPARDAFLRAFMREPGNGSVRTHLLTLETVTGLDPTLRQLTSAEKYRRSIRILQMTRAGVDECLSKTPTARSGLGSQENQQLLHDADAAVTGKPPQHATNEMAEEVLSVAGKLWLAETKVCKEEPSDQNALDLIMRKLNS